MANSYDALQAEAKTRIEIVKSAFSFAVAQRWYSSFTATGIPAAGTNSLSVQTTGEILTSDTPGFAPARPYEYGLITDVEFAASIAANGPVVRAKLLDTWMRFGTYAYNANTVVDPTLQDSVSASGWLWLEVVTAITGTITVTVESQGGAYSTALTLAAPAAGTFWLFPAFADTDDPWMGSMTRVTGTGASAGTFNLWFATPVWQGAVGPGLPGPSSTRYGLNELGVTESYSNDRPKMLLLRSSATGTVPIEFAMTLSTEV